MPQNFISIVNHISDEEGWIQVLNATFEFCSLGVVISLLEVKVVWSARKTALFVDFGNLSKDNMPTFLILAKIFDGHLGWSVSF